MTSSRRFSILSKRDINKDSFVEPWPEAGLCVTDSPYDPQPSLRMEAGRVVEMDGKSRQDFDALDIFIADHSLDLSVAEEAMSTPSLQIARMLVDINVPRAQVQRLVSGCTPARLVEIVRSMSVLEMMVGLGKMRVRRTPANQAHVTNLAANTLPCWPQTQPKPPTTASPRSKPPCGSPATAPLNALAVLVGSQTGRGGVLTQCAVEEVTGAAIWR